MCASGDVEEGAFHERERLVSVGENTFVCHDGTGSFVLETEIDTTGFEGEGVPDGDWRVVSGTGSYEQLQANGVHHYMTTDEEVYATGSITAVVQVVTGDVGSG